MSFSHHRKDGLNEIEWHVMVKKITHRIDKDLPGLSPLQRLVNYIRL
jgi:hypothetical protein